MMLKPAEVVFQSVEEFYRRVYWQAPGATTVWADNWTLSYSGVSWLHSVNHLWLHNPRSTAAIDETSQSLTEWLETAGEFFRQFGADYNVVCNVPTEVDFA